MSKLWKSLLDFGANPARRQTDPTNPDAARHQTKPARLNPADRNNYSVGPAIVPYDHAPNVCEENVPEIKPEGENLVELQQHLIAQLQQEMCDMASAMRKKDKTIIKLKKEVDEHSQNCEGQLTMLMGLDKMVNEKDATNSDQADTINQLQAKLDYYENLPMVESPSEHDVDNSFGLECDKPGHHELEEKFRALYVYCRSLACERDKLKNYITTLSLCESKAREISTQQEKLTKSLIALVDREKKTKFIEGSHTLHYSVTEPRPDVRDEMASAVGRIREEEIIKLADVVNVLAAKYSPGRHSLRYDSSCPTNDSEPRSGPQQMFSWVHMEMLAMWVYVLEEEEVTPEEEELYNKFLQKQLRPDPISSPHLPKASVNWNRLNPGQFRNLPSPSELPVSGCSPDPNFYLEKEPRRKEYRVIYIPKWETLDYPFGKLFGFITNMGVVSVPDQPVHGYRCCETTGVWMIDARGW